MERLLPLEKDYYCVEDDQSDRENGSESSEDEMKETFAKLAGVVTCPTRKRRNSDENDFDLEMDKELTSAFDARNSHWLTGGQSVVVKKRNIVAESDIFAHQPCTSNVATKEDDEEDDEEAEVNVKGTESDEEFCATEGMNRNKEETDLFYDPKSDQDNQDWVNSHRQNNTHTSQRLPNSDAVLNCPCCMGVLCYDCQRHELYHTQYRAMFVVNCAVQNNEVLFQPSSRRRSISKRKQADLNIKAGQKLTAAPEGCDPKDLFRPVLCVHCNTEVAVYDADEIYHFFNVLASYT